VQQISVFDEVRQVEFVGPGDPAIWLEDKNGEQNPTVIPLWPEDFPNHLAIYMCESGEIGVALSRQAMLQACRKLLQESACQWFCNIPLADFLAATNADPQWLIKS
jgi:hypothetical protein